MSTQQGSYNTYIGARYVPIFSGQWDNTKAYEPLVIAEYQGNSYTSKTYVPIGADINNTDYWALTGNYNAQIEAYRQEVAQLKQQVNTFNENIENIQNELDTTNLNVSNNTNLINTKQTKTYKKAIIVGDSWSVGYYDGKGHPGQGWGDYACPLLGVEKNNILTVGSGGSGFINGTGEHFSDQIVRAYNDYSDFRDADIILCVGGFNDAQDNQSFSAVQTAAGLFFSNCKKYFPNAECHMFPLQLPYGKESAMTTVRWNVLSAIKQAFYNQTGGNLFIHDGIRRWANSFGVGASAEDGSHLNQYGYNYLGQLIAMCVRKTSDYYPTLIRTADLNPLGSHAGSVITNKIVESDGVLDIYITFEATNWASEYIPMPDIASVKGVSYFYVGDKLMVWNENGIKPNTDSLSGVVNIALSTIAGR